MIMRNLDVYYKEIIFGDERLSPECKCFMLRNIMSIHEYMEEDRINHCNFIYKDAGKDFQRCYKCRKDSKEWLLKKYKEAELSSKEKIILKTVENNWDYIVRNKNGNLVLFKGEEPIQTWSLWTGGAEYDFSAFNDLFSFIKWEDTEPRNIKELLG